MANSEEQVSDRVARRGTDINYLTSIVGVYDTQDRKTDFDDLEAVHPNISFAPAEEELPDNSETPSAMRWDDEDSPGQPGVQEGESDDDDEDHESKQTAAEAVAEAEGQGQSPALDAEPAKELLTDAPGNSAPVAGGFASGDASDASPDAAQEVAGPEVNPDAPVVDVNAEQHLADTQAETVIVPDQGEGEAHVPGHLPVDQVAQAEIPDGWDHLEIGPMRELAASLGIDVAPTSNKLTIIQKIKTFIAERSES